MIADELSIVTEHPDPSQQRVLLEQILTENRLCSMATVNPEGEPHINTAYYAYDDGLRLYVLTPPRTEHARNLVGNAAVALTIFRSDQTWAGPHRGVQLFGSARLLEGEDQAKAFEEYSERFPELMALAESSDALTTSLESRFYEIAIKRIKLTDEEANGAESLVTLEILR